MVRLATIDDLNDMLRIYDAARKFMRDNGNMTQWVNGYPHKECLIEDIEIGQAYVYEEDGKVHGVFILQFGDDPTYGRIDDGAWLNDESYATIHRIASDGEVRGVFNKCVEYSKTRCENLRIDTHESNFIMQKLCENNGFKYCGVIYVADLTPRVAYQYVN